MNNSCDIHGLVRRPEMFIVLWTRSRNTCIFGDNRLLPVRCATVRAASLLHFLGQYLDRTAVDVVIYYGQFRFTDEQVYVRSIVDRTVSVLLAIEKTEWLQ